MAITVYRSRFANSETTAEKVERLRWQGRAPQSDDDGGAGCDFSFAIKETLLSALRDGSLDMFRSAYAMANLIERFEMTQGELAAALSLSQSAVANKLRLLRFSEEEREIILSSALTERHARALLRLKSGEERRGALDRVVSERMSVSETERLVLTLAPDAETRPRRGKGAVSDLRFFCNSIDRAVDLARRAGVAIELERRELDGTLEMRIRIPMTQNQKLPS